MINVPRSISISLPDYLFPVLARGMDETSVEARMRFAIELSRVNVANGGGPFGACIFNLDSGALVSVGVNLVVPACCSVAHAEMVAIMLAQQGTGSFSLADAGRHQLVTSAEPCAQCFGAIPWSGVEEVVFGATKSDVESIGFDEGPKPRTWRKSLRDRGIRVEGPLLRNAASSVLHAYAKAGQPIYNGSD